MKLTLKQIEEKARAYFYNAKNPRKAIESATMNKLNRQWVAAGGLETGYTFGDVLA